MTFTGKRMLARFAAFATSAALLIGAASCSSTEDSHSEDPKPTTNSATAATTGKVAVFTPSDGVSIGQSTPMNRWPSFVSDLTEALHAAHVDSDDITTSTASSLDEQSRDIQDYVVEHVTKSNAGGSQQSTDDDAADASITLVIAPVVDDSAIAHDYGDFVSMPDTASTPDNASTQSSDAATSEEGGSETSDSSDSSSTDAHDATSDDGSNEPADSGKSTDGGTTSGTNSSSTDNGSAASDTDAAIARLNSSITLARESGMHVIMLSNNVTGVSPDALVRFSTARQIGQIQAEKLVTKLDLGKTNKDNPKTVEVLLPISAKSGTAEYDLQSAFLKEAFMGIWQILDDYFKSGKLVSASGLLTADSTEQDWSKLLVDASKTTNVQRAVSERLKSSDDTAKDATMTHIDGIIGLTDTAASQIIKELSAMGYTGTAADINPSISITGIVGNIIGKHDLTREPVPDPIKSPDNDDAANNKPDKQYASQWPIVTGYGAFVDSMPQIVNGQQWMTALEDRKAIATDVADACVTFNRKASIDKRDYVTMETIRTDGNTANNSNVDGGNAKTDNSNTTNSNTTTAKTIPVISEAPLAVSASNLKSALIDPGYISLADAGL